MASNAIPFWGAFSACPDGFCARLLLPRCARWVRPLFSMPLKKLPSVGPAGSLSRASGWQFGSLAAFGLGIVCHD